jgi:hypothetical protein
MRLILLWAYYKGGAFIVVLWGSVTQARLILQWAYYKRGAFVVVLFTAHRAHHVSPSRGRVLLWVG